MTSHFTWRWSVIMLIKITMLALILRDQLFTIVLVFTIFPLLLWVLLFFFFFLSTLVKLPLSLSPQCLMQYIYKCKPFLLLPLTLGGGSPWIKLWIFILFLPHPNRSWHHNPVISSHSHLVTLIYITRYSLVATPQSPKKILLYVLKQFYWNLFSPFYLFHFKDLFWKHNFQTFYPNWLKKK